MSKATLKTETTSKQVTSFTYNDKGQRTSVTRPNGGTSSSIYDDKGNQVKSVNALGFTTETLAFDKAGRPLKTKSINGEIAEVTYDSMGRILTTKKGDLSRINEYDSNGRNIRVTYSDGKIEEKKYDNNNNVIESWDNQGYKKKNYYNSNNKLIKSEIYREGILVRQDKNEYDNKNKLITQIDTQGNRITYDYNNKGQQTKVTDALGRVTQFIYNSKGQLSETINPDGKSIIYKYNADGHQIEIKTINGTTFTFDYDSLGRVISKGNSDKGIVTYTYDVSGNIVTETNAKGEVKTYTYDLKNRKTSVSYSTDSTLNETYIYDQGANAKGKLTKITDSSGSTSFTYDINGNLIKKIQNIANQQFEISYLFNKQKKMVQQTYPSGKVIGYEHDNTGELVSITIDGEPYISNIKKNENKLFSYLYADNTKHSRTYDQNGRVIKLNYPNYTEEINYDAMSNITKVKLDSSIDIDFGYDKNNRLISYDQNETDYQYFTYDGNGNRITQNQEKNISKVFNYLSNTNILNTIEESNGTNIKKINYKYDKIGNIIDDGTHIYKYDARNRLIAIDNNITYQYNYNNRRVSKTVNGVKTYFIYDRHMLIGEYRLNLQDDSIKENIYLGGIPIATTIASETYKVYADSFGTPRRLSTEDNTIIWRWDSRPFGETAPVGAVEFNLRFPGQYFDAETGNHYNINRDYNPITGRYIQSDPIGFDGGVNTFAYVNGNPAISIDLEGLSDTTEVPEPVLSVEEIRQNILKEQTQVILDYKGSPATPWSDAIPELPSSYKTKLDSLYKANRVKYVDDPWRMINGRKQRAFATADLAHVGGGFIRVTSDVWLVYGNTGYEGYLEQVVRYELVHELYHIMLNTTGHPPSRAAFDAKLQKWGYYK